MHLLKWKCANECRLLTIGKIEVVSMYKGRSRGRREDALCMRYHFFITNWIAAVHIGQFDI